MKVRDLILIDDEPEYFQEIVNFFNKIKEMDVDSDVEFYVVEIKTPLREEDKGFVEKIDVEKIFTNLHFNYFFVKKIQWA